MEIKINNNTYKIFFVNSNSEKLQMEDGEFHSGTIDFYKKEIYIADDLNQDTLRYTLIHELTHAVIDSYGFLQVDWNDEVVADFMANYIPNIADFLNKIEEKSKADFLNKFEEKSKKE